MRSSTPQPEEPTSPRPHRGLWLSRIGWAVAALLLVLFLAGLHHRSRLEDANSGMIRMLFVPSVEQGTLVRRGDELARFIRSDCGLMLRSEVPTSYAAVIQALGTGQADVAWIPAFAYVLAHARYGAEARLQVVRSLDLFAIVVTRDGPGEPTSLAGLAGRRIAVPRNLKAELRREVTRRLNRSARGWVEVPVDSDLAAVRQMVESPGRVDAAVSSHVFSGPHDLIGDGRKELEAERPGTLRETRVIDVTEDPVAQLTTTYNGCILTRTDSGVRTLADLNGRSFAFSDETSTSGHIFARALLNRASVHLGHVYFAGGHPNVVQAVLDGKVAGGAAFYSPPGEREVRDHTLVGDARRLIIKRLPDDEARRRLLDEVRIIALTDPIPNDVCCVRKGFPRRTWERFETSLQRFLKTEEGQLAYHDLVAGVAAAPCGDSDFDRFREALRQSGVSATKVLEAEEAKLKKRKAGKGSGS
jgi:ABC-type phosphate/phosphonate transport system substrate-binding protein